MKRRLGLRFFSTLLVFLFSCAAMSACAAEQNGAAATERASEIFRWINFAILAGLVIWVFAKKLPPLFHRNAERISSAISKATADKQEAERKLHDAEGKLAKLEEEIKALRAEAQEESAAEAERIRTLAQSEAKKVGVAAQMEIEAAERAARQELKALAASLAVDGAESLLDKQLTPAAQEKLMDAFVKSLEGRPN